MRETTSAVVLRKTKLGESDLIVTLLGESSGRLSAVARGARKSFRRFGGALEIGTRVEAEIAPRANRDLHTLVRCDVLTPVAKIRQDYDRIAHLSYVLEIAWLVAREGVGEPVLYRLLCAYIETLEAAPATDEALVCWQLALLTHLGYGAHPELNRLPPAALAVAQALGRGDIDARLGPEEAELVRRVFLRVWEHVTGRGLRTGAILAGTAR